MNILSRFYPYHVRFLAVVAAIAFSPLDLSAASLPSIQEREARADKLARELIPKMTLEEKVLQTFVHTANGVPRLGIPHLPSGEALHGAVAAGCTSFPQSIALGASFDPDLLEEVAAVIARESRAVGICQAFAPMLAVSRDPRWGRVEESYGEDPHLVSRMGVAFINGLQGRGDSRFGPDRIIATPKHFVADGEPWSGANGEGFDTSERTLREIYLAPFEAAIREAASMSIMPGHHAINGVPCHMNPWLLQTVLRDEWGFGGFVTSDMGDIPKVGVGGGYGGYRIVRDEEASVIASMRAGVDAELVGKWNRLLVKAVREGKIPEAVIDRAAERVLRAKILLFGLAGPSKNPPSGNGKDATGDSIRNYKGDDDVWAKLIADGKFDTPENAKRSDWQSVVNDPRADSLALKAAQKSIVLLKNKGHVLPLDKTKIRRILVAGPLASEVNLGGYSTGKPKFFVTAMEGITKAAEGSSLMVEYAQGCHRLPGQEHSGRHPVEKNQPDSRDDASLVAEAVEKARTADVIVAVVGHGRPQLGENLDRDTLDLPGGQQALVEALHATGKPVVVVLNSGNVHSVGWIKKNIPAILQAFYLGQSSGTVIAQALFGEVNPGGKLPLSFPRNVGQSPWYYNHPPLTGPVNYYGKENDPSYRGGPLWSFGHGLSYTTFGYSDLTVSPTSFAKGETATVSATVTNTGNREGDEVVQLYLRQDFTSLVRPVKELKGFRRITLKPGESRAVSFSVGDDQIRFWKNGAWTAEPGRINIMIGSSSEDIRLRGAVDYIGSPDESKTRMTPPIP
jgi:beta-glucosidase